LFFILKSNPFGHAKCLGAAKLYCRATPPGAAGLPPWLVSCALTADVAGPCRAVDSGAAVPRHPAWCGRTEYRSPRGPPSLPLIPFFFLGPRGCELGALNPAPLSLLRPNPAPSDIGGRPQASPQPRAR